MEAGARPGPGKHRGTHALRRRCPACHKLRRFYEPPGDVTPNPRSGRERAGWRVINGRWVCPFCTGVASQ
jgi:hypothetical protein